VADAVARFNELYGPRQYAPRSAMSPVLARMARVAPRVARRQLAARPPAAGAHDDLVGAGAAAARHRAVDGGPDDEAGARGAAGRRSGRARAQARPGVRRRKARPFGELVEAVFTGADVASRVAALKMARRSCAVASQSVIDGRDLDPALSSRR
jgi:hypothetical protein